MKKLVYSIAAGAVVLGTIGYFGVNSFAQASSQNKVDAVEEVAPVILESNDIIVDAIVVPVREADLSLATTGIVNSVFVEEGDYVEAGQSLVQLRSERLGASLAQANANLANAQANLADLLAPPQAEEVAKLQSSVTSAHASLQTVLDGANNAEIAAKEADLANAAAEMRQAQSDYDEVKWRSDIGMLPESLALEKATNNYNAARANLDDLLAAADPDDVASANASIVAAQSDLDLLLAGSTQEAIAAAQATVAANQAMVNDAQAALNEATLVAPFSGIVAAVDAEVGEQVSSGYAVIQLADTTEWRIETEDLTELDVVDVERGDRVDVRFDALEETALMGIVKNIKPLGENNQGDITYTVLVELDEQDDRLRWNMSAEASIAADQAGRTAAEIAAPLTIGDVLPAPEVALELATVNVNGSVLNVRQGPSTDFSIIERLTDGTVVTIIESNADASWMHVALDGGETGWVSADYLQIDNGTQT